jgi:hypothetical protein
MNMQDKIDLYLENMMDPAEKMDFETKMKTNPDLAEEVEKRIHINNTLEKNLEYDSVFNSKEDRKLFPRAVEYSIEEDIIRFHKEKNGIEAEDQIKLRRKIRDIINKNENEVNEAQIIYKVAASLAFLILIISTLMFYTFRQHSERSRKASILAEAFFKPEEDKYISNLKDSILFMRNTVETDFLNPEQYKLMKEYISGNALLLDAISDINSRDYEASFKKFEKLNSHLHGINHSAFYWYYSILLFMDGNYKEASAILNELSNDNNNYKSMADSLNRELLKYFQ